MNRTAKSRNLQNTFVKTAVAAATAAVMTLSVATPATADTNLNDLYTELSLAVSQITRAETPLGQEAIAPNSNIESIDRFNGFLDNISILGASEPGFVPPAVAGGTPSPTDQYRLAVRAYETLMLRCDYWRSQAGGTSGRHVDNEQVADRIAALEGGSQLIAEPVQLGRTYDAQEVEAVLNDIANFNYVINEPPLPMLSFSDSPTNLNIVLNQFYARVTSLCPAESIAP